MSLIKIECLKIDRLEQWFSVWGIKYYRFWKWKVQIILKQISLVVHYLRID